MPWAHKQQKGCQNCRLSAWQDHLCVELSPLRNQEFFLRVLLLNQPQILENHVLPYVSFIISPIIYAKKSRCHLGRCYSSAPFLTFQSIQCKVVQWHCIQTSSWAWPPQAERSVYLSTGSTFPQGPTSPCCTTTQTLTRVDQAWAGLPWTIWPAFGDLLASWVQQWAYFNSESRNKDPRPLFYSNVVHQAVIRMVVTK